MLTVLAPAKINLTLEVLAKRPDGFHEIRSVIQTINLCDSIHLQLSENVELKSSMSGWVSDASLVSKTIGLLQDITGCGKGAAVRIEKHIPLVSGLGGDSSDAVAILGGLNRLWELGLSQEELIGFARQLGSDVVFFFYGGTALLEGRGEIVTPLPLLPRMWVVLMMPSMPRLQRKTERLYTSLKASHYTDGQITDRLVTQKARGGEVVSPIVFNVFDKVALENFAGLDAYWQQFLQAGAGEVHLAGSGPALFTLVKDETDAEMIHRHLQQQGLESYLTDTLAATEYVE